MRIGTTLAYSGGFKQSAAELRDLEAAGLEIAYVPEAYSFDAVSQLGYLAAVTERVQLASAIVPIYTRTPSLLAMTAAGLDHVSDGRFTLGLGASGPQVVEGFHGVPYDAPVARTREIVEICRRVWSRQEVVYQGRHYQLPLPPDQGTGLGKPLKLINHPVRDRIPVMLAAIGPKNVELAAEIAESWLPIFVHPGKLSTVWGPSLSAGQARRDPGLGPLDIVVTMKLAIGDDVADLLDRGRPQLALYIGGMGARGKNFYNTLARRYGYEREAELIQELYLSGRKREAEAAVPDELLRATSLVGPKEYVAERIAELAECGVTTLSVTPLADTRTARVAAIEQLRHLVP